MLTKSESLQLKGSAILIMVLLHLFNRQENIDKCIISINLLGEPLVSQLAKFVEICVPLYLFLSGYGLYLLFEKNNTISPLKRVLKLYLIFWSCIIRKSKFPWFPERSVQFSGKRTKRSVQKKGCTQHL